MSGSTGDSTALQRAKPADGVITPTTQIVFELGRASRMGIAHELKSMRSKYFICYVQKVYKRRITIPLHTDRNKLIVESERLLAAGERGR